MNEEWIHPFEQAGLGKAPFRIVGIKSCLFQTAPGEPVRAGGSCHYCSTAIRTAVLVEGADGSKFKVGCDCAVKADPRWEPRIKRYRSGERRAKADAKRARDRKIAQAKKVAARDEVLGLLIANRKALIAIPHPLAWRAEQGDTMADWVEWMVDRCGVVKLKEMSTEIQKKLDLGQKSS